MFLENDSHFGRHREFMKKVQKDYWGLFICYSSHVLGAMLKNSDCCELVQAFNLGLYVLRK